MRKSKHPGIEYETKNIAGKRYVTVTFFGQRVYHSARPQKVSRVIRASEERLNPTLLQGFMRALNAASSDIDFDAYSAYCAELRDIA